MDIRSYLNDHQIGRTAFAAQIGVTTTALYRYMNGDRLPRPATIMRIAEATKGAVTAADFYPSISSAA